MTTRAFIRTNPGALVPSCPSPPPVDAQQSRNFPHGRIEKLGGGGMTEVRRTL
jgi:hypothetical protein